MFLLVLVVLAAALAVSTSMAFIIAQDQRAARNRLWSVQAQYAANSGLEDAFLRVSKGMNWTSPILLSAGGVEAETAVSEDVGGARTITAKGDMQDRVRRFRAVFRIQGEEGSFFYGAQAGEGGVRLSNLSSIIGSVFSNGDVTMSSGTEITGDAIIAGAGGVLSGGNVGGDAQAASCQNASIAGVLSTNSNNACEASQVDPLGDPSDPIPLPVSDEMIQGWKQAAEAGGTISGDYILSGSSQADLGPVKIQGDLEVSSQARLNVTGTIWVTGSITLSNLAQARLSSGYGSSSGVIVADGLVTLKNISVSQGTGQEGSYLMYVSTLAEDPAVILKNNAEADILFASEGWVEVQNNADLREVTGYGIHTKNNAELQYETGLANTFFTSSASGGWSISSWKEVE